MGLFSETGSRTWMSGMHGLHASKLRPGVRLLMLVCLFLGSLSDYTSLFAQPIKATVFKNPVVDVISSDVALHIDAVILTDSGTSLKITATYTPGNRLNIPKQSYISFEDAGSIKGADTSKYFVSSTAGVEIGYKNHMPASGVLQYTLNFPLRLNNNAINNKGLKLHFGENLPDGKQVYGIDYLWKDKPMVKELIGRWYNKATGDLAYIIRPDVVISGEGQIASITGGNAKKEVLILNNNGRQVNLYYTLKKGDLQTAGDKAGLEKGNTAVYTQDKLLCKRAVSEDKHLDVALRADTSIIRGYIEGFEKAGKGTTIQFFVDDMILGNQVNYLAEIQPDGSFEVKIPVYGAIQPFVRSDYFNGSWYLEPGKTLFVVLGLSGDEDFMGPLAKLNRDMQMLDAKLRGDWSWLSSRIGVKSTSEIKAGLLEQEANMNTQLDSIYNAGLIAGKAYAYKKLRIKYGYATQLLYYVDFYKSIYRRNNHLDKTENVPDLTIPKDYYDFLTADLMENLNILNVSDAFSFVNYLKFQKYWEPKSYEMHVKAIIESLAAKGMQFTADELSLSHLQMGKADLEDSVKRMAYDKKLRAFLYKYGPEYRIYYSANYRDSVMQSYAITHGIVNDLMFVQDYANNVWSQLTPVDTATLRIMQLAVTNPVLKNQMAVINNRALDKIARSKKSSGFYVRNSSEIKADAIFDSIIAPYKGNVLYIDFWATWCAPCRQAIEDIKPVKQQLTAKPVKFIYITNETSPLKTWNNFIPNVKGEHFRLNNDQWTYLCKKFNVSGIPHVVVVDKAGKVIDPHYAFFGQDIKAKIEGLL